MGPYGRPPIKKEKVRKPSPIKRATLEDVARAAGVGPMTVSRTINGHPYVADETAKKVRAAIRANRSDNRASRNSVWKAWTKERGRLSTNRTNKKQHRTVEITDPDLACARVEVEGAPLINLRKFVRATYDFDADIGRSGKNLAILG